jgi:hypothetical protein
MPFLLGKTATVVHHPGKDEQKITETVEVPNRLLTYYRFNVTKRDYPPLTPPADSPGNMKSRTCRPATREDETAKGGEFFLETIDILLQTRDRSGCNARNLQIFSLFLDRSRQVGSEYEEFLLNPCQ